MSTPALVITELDDAVDAIRETRRGIQRRTNMVLTVSIVILVFGLAGEILLGGSADIPLSEVPGGILGNSGGLADFVIHETRLPRALAGVGAGALFGLSGVVYQRLIANVLATPDIIGVSAGASSGAAIVLVLAGASGVAVQGGAIIGAALAVLLIFALAWNNGAATYRLVLVGIGVGACFSAVTSYVLLFADDATSERAMRWMIGTLSGASWSDVKTLFITLCLGLAAVMFLHESLETLRLGDPLAASLGTKVQLVRISVLLLGAVLAAIATSACGPIAFVALVAGPIAMRLTPGAGPLPAVFIGADVLVLSDVIAQSAPLISPVPTGVVTGIVGAPVLLFLLINRKGDAG